MLGLSLLCSKIYQLCLWHFPNFLPIMLVLCFLAKHYADNFIFVIVYLMQKQLQCKKCAAK